MWAWGILWNEACDKTRLLPGDLCRLDRELPSFSCQVQGAIEDWSGFRRYWASSLLQRGNTKNNDRSEPTLTILIRAHGPRFQVSHELRCRSRLQGHQQAFHNIRCHVFLRIVAWSRGLGSFRCRLRYVCKRFAENRRLIWRCFINCQRRDEDRSLQLCWASDPRSQRLQNATRRS